EFTAKDIEPEGAAELELAVGRGGMGGVEVLETVHVVQGSSVEFATAVVEGNATELLDEELVLTDKVLEVVVEVEVVELVDRVEVI
ncbi:hypothetical protein HDU96_009663, partial [Phlyctochytrium bullatum]